AVGRVVGGANGLLLGRETRDPRDRAERLLAAHRHLRFDPHEDRRLEEGPAQRVGLAAQDELRAALDGVLDVPPHLGEAGVFEHCSITSFPTSVEPVKPTFRTSGLDVSSPPITGASPASPVTTLKTPGGNPACSPSFITASAVSGVCSAGFSTIVFPVASAGAAFRAGIAAGKFQGVMPALGPTGCLRTSTRRSCRYV